MPQNDSYHVIARNSEAKASATVKAKRNFWQFITILRYNIIICIIS